MEDLSCADESLISNYLSKTPMLMKLDCKTFQTEKLCLLRKFEISEVWMCGSIVWPLDPHSDERYSPATCRSMSKLLKNTTAHSLPLGCH